MTEWQAFKPWDLFWAGLRTIDLEAKCQSAIDKQPISCN